MIVILMGPPGAGKGTQAQMLASQYGLRHLSTGDLLRAAVADGSEIGSKAKSFMNAGKLVPDEVITGIVLEYIRSHSSEGLLLDGFPRTVPQAKGLARELDFSELSILTLELDDEEVVSRLSGRRVCRTCGSIYNRAHLGTTEECDCGGELYQRDDDKRETIKHRLEVYHAQTTPVIEFYRAQGRVSEIEGSGKPEEVFARLRKALG